MYRMEFDTLPPITLATWLDVENHPLFPIATISQRVAFGWMAI